MSFPNFTRLDRLALSSWAMAAMMVTMNSDSPSTLRELLTKMHSMPRAFSLRMLSRESTVFRAKREMSLTTTSSNSPRSASRSIWRKPSRFFSHLPEIPWSA